ncbi:MAG TPA: ROK family protein [Chryseosolibacter sp.]|jgi:glucokinase|nr:ROK family protein [Chryseosolibacter sp.]
MIIGVDLGGTKVRAGLARGERIENQKQQLVKSKGSQEETLGQLIDLIRSLMVPGVEGIGLGVPSVVDVEKGIVYDVVNIPSWKRVPLKDILEEAFSVPVAVNNDSNCFALGEHRFGKLKGFRTAVGITSGTGVGGGVIINNELFTGNNCGAGEFGLLSYRDHNIEYYASGNFFESVHGISAIDAHDRAVAGDRSVMPLWNEFGVHVGQVIKSVVLAVDPEAIVIGGSLSKAFALFDEPMRQSLRNFEYPGSIERLKIFQSVNEDITLLGASALIDPQRKSPGA